MAVYLAHGYTRKDPRLVPAQRRAVALGYRRPAVDDIDCDRGARTALGLSPSRDYVAVALYFPTRARARAFVDAYAPGVVGLGRILRID